MLTSETKHRIDSCRDILVGKLPLPSDQVELITLALIYKFMDDLDEDSVRLGGSRSFFVDGLQKYRWRALMPQTISADERMTLFAEGIETLGGARANGNDPAKHLPPLFRDIFRNEFLKFRDGRTLTLFLTEIDGFSYSHGEELGDAFEYLLQCMGTQGENGQFLTPRHIIDFMVACLDPQPTDRILDPSCGTCGFLVSSFRHILAAHTSPGSSLPGDRLSHDQRQQLYRNFTGYDITDLMVKLSKVNLFLHGFPDPAIHIYDTLTNDARWNDKADLILANPPFMTPKGGVTPHARFRVAAKKAEVLFTDYIAEHLSADGRAGVIVPNGIVATTQNAYVALRRFLVEDSLVAVVSLPAGVFKPYSGVKTSILFLDKALARRTDSILFLKVTADGFDLGDQRRQIEANDLPEAERVVKAWMQGKLGSSAESRVAWQPVERAALLENRSVSFQAETLLEESAGLSDHAMARIGDTCTVISGQHIDSDDYNNDRRGIGYLTGPSDFGPTSPIVSKWTEKPKVTAIAGDVLLTVKGSGVGSVNVLLEGELAISRQLMAVRAKNIEPRYLHALLRQQKGYFASLANGAAIPGITRDHVLNLEIPVPPLEEQRRIVDEIEGYQKIVDGARQILAAYRPRFLVDPDWPLVALQEVASFSSGGTPPKTIPEYWTGSIPWISAKDMKKPKLSDAALHVSESAITGTATQLAPTGAILVLVRGMGLANGVPICELLAPCAFNQDVKALLPGPTVESAFLAAALRQEVGQLRNVIGTAAHGTLKIESDRLQQIRVPLPSLEEQQRIVADLDAEAAQIEAVRALMPRNEAKIQRVLDHLWSNRERGE